MNKIKKFFSFMICIVMVFSTVACSSTKKNDNKAEGASAAESTAGQQKTENKHEDAKAFNDKINDGKPVKLLVEINNLLPTLNTEPTEQQPKVFLSSQKIADEFMKLYPNVTIEWDRTKVNSGDWAQWMTTQVAAGTAPDIVFLHGGMYADRGWYMRLNEVIEQPNEYVDGNSAWKDMFPQYLWKDGMQVDAAGNIVAIPITLYPGPPTAYYYNKEIFDKVGVSIPNNWEELMNVSKKINDAGYVAIGPWSLNKKINTALWDIQFSLGPVYAGNIIDKIDLNKDGFATPDEFLKAQYEGHFFMKNNEFVKDLYAQVKRKYTEVLQEGVDTTDYETLWLEGKVAMMEDGLWRFPQELSNTKRTFDFGMFPPPVATKETSKYVGDIEFTEKGSGPYQPSPLEAFNIVEPSVKARGEGNREAAVKFLKFLSKPENVSAMIMELRGAAIGAVKGSEIPPELDEWFQCQFPKLPKVGWSTGPTTEAHSKMSKQLEMWVKGMIDEAAFIKDYDAALQKGIEDQARNLKIDTSSWNKGW